MHCIHTSGVHSVHMEQYTESMHWCSSTTIHVTGFAHKWEVHLKKFNYITYNTGRLSNFCMQRWQLQVMSKLCSKYFWEKNCNSKRCANRYHWAQVFTLTIHNCCTVRPDRKVRTWVIKFYYILYSITWWPMVKCTFVLAVKQQKHVVCTN